MTSWPIRLDHSRPSNHPTIRPWPTTHCRLNVVEGGVFDRGRGPWWAWVCKYSDNDSLFAPASGAQRGSGWPCYRCDSCLNGHVYACSQKQDPTSGSKTKHKEPKRSSKKRSLSNNDHSCKVCAKR